MTDDITRRAGDLGMNVNDITRPAIIELLKGVLTEIHNNDNQYDVRYTLVFAAMNLANSVGYDVGVKFNPQEPEWPIFYIDLPTGQISWHMPEYTGDWDGHSTEEKYRRVNNYINSHSDLD